MRGRMPYGQFDTLYPPLAICFSMCCICLCQRHNQLRGRNRLSQSRNMKGTERDLRLQQATIDAVYRLCYRGGLRNCIDDRTPDAQLRGAERAAGILRSVQLWGTVRLGTRQYSAVVLAVNGIFYPVPQFRKPTFAGIGLSGAGDCRRFQAVPGVSGRAAAAR